MRYRYYTADVFTDRVFGGNPLAVFPKADELTQDQMQKVARELNLSETVFITKPENRDNACRLRIFTPQTELPFAGHPTLGSAHVLSLLGEIKAKDGETELIFEEKIGPITVKILAEGGQPVFTQLAAAKMPEFAMEIPSLRSIASALSLDISDLLLGDDRPVAVSCGVPFLIVPIRNLEGLERARLDRETWENALQDTWAPNLYAFVYDAKTEGADLRARVFAPGMGIEEDPATGAGACALAGYLCSLDKGSQGSRYWTVEQGFEMGRPSLLKVEADLEDGKAIAIRVGGASVLVGEGQIDIPKPGEAGGLTLESAAQAKALVALEPTSPQPEKTEPPEAEPKLAEKPAEAPAAAEKKPDETVAKPEAAAATADKAEEARAEKKVEETGAENAKKAEPTETKPADAATAKDKAEDTLVGTKAEDASAEKKAEDIARPKTETAASSASDGDGKAKLPGLAANDLVAKDERAEPKPRDAEDKKAEPKDESAVGDKIIPLRAMLRSLKGEKPEGAEAGKAAETEADGKTAETAESGLKLEAKPETKPEAKPETKMEPEKAETTAASSALAAEKLAEAKAPEAEKSEPKEAEEPKPDKEETTRVPMGFVVRRDDESKPKNTDPAPEKTAAAAADDDAERDDERTEAPAKTGGIQGFRDVLARSFRPQDDAVVDENDGDEDPEDDDLRERGFDPDDDFDDLEDDDDLGDDASDEDEYFRHERFKREEHYKFLWSATLRHGDQIYACVIIDLSSKAALVQLEEELAYDLTLKFDSPITLKNDKIGRLQGEVAWREKNRLGIELLEDPDEVVKLLDAARR